MLVWQMPPTAHACSNGAAAAAIVQYCAEDLARYVACLAVLTSCQLVVTPSHPPGLPYLTTTEG